MNELAEAAILVQCGLFQPSDWEQDMSSKMNPRLWWRESLDRAEDFQTMRNPMIEDEN